VNPSVLRRAGRLGWLTTPGVVRARRSGLLHSRESERPAKHARTIAFA